MIFGEAVQLLAWSGSVPVPDADIDADVVGGRLSKAIAMGVVG